MSSRIFATLLLVALLAPQAAWAGRAKLLDATWDAASVPSASEVTDDDHRLTTTLADPPADLVAHATLTYDVTYGDNGILSFLSTHPWVTCEAPDGLIVPESGKVAVVCRAPAAKLAGVKKKTEVKLKADPPGGGAHKKFFWILLPAP